MDHPQNPTFPTLSDAESYSRAQASETSDFSLENPTSDALSDAAASPMIFPGHNTPELAVDQT